MLCAAPVFAAHDHDQLAISVAFDEQGWLWRAQAGDQQVLVSHSYDLGHTFSAPVSVNTVAEPVSAGGESRPKIVAAGGRVYVSWSQSLPQRFAGHIRFAVSVDDGKSFSAPRTINSDLNPITHRFDALTATADGHVALAWIDKRDGEAAKQAAGQYAGAAIYVAESRDGGVSFEANRKLADHSCECCRIAIARDADSMPVIMWRQVFGKNTRDFALARFGEPLQRVSEDGWNIDACPHHGGALAVDNKGSRHLAWFTGADAAPGLFYRRMDGQALTAPLAFGNSELQTGHPAVLAGEQRVFLVWQEYDGKTTSIRVIVSQDRGNTWDSLMTQASTTGAADYPQLVAGRGHAWLVWNSADQGLQVIDLGPL
ncbi:MAG: exo-alpha-sialidase [Gammaproteobacteria bacterium]|nr:exo-alpha-sialidase [Gammaproteobacteria bacterium]